MMWLWITIGAAALLLEVITPTALVSIWFLLGAVAALLLALLHMPEWIQIAVFFLVSLGTLAIVRPVAVRTLRGTVISTNADRLIGTTVIVQSAISMHQIGQVKAGSVIWNAITRNEPLETGETARVLAIDGNKLVVVKEKGKNV